MPEVGSEDRHAAQARKNRRELTGSVNANLFRPLGAGKNEQAMRRPKGIRKLDESPTIVLDERQLHWEAGHEKS